MTITSFPFENQTTTETQYSWLFREAQDTGVVGGYGSSALAVSVDGSTVRTIDIAPGQAIVRGFMLNSNAIEFRAIAAVSSGTQRIDTIALQLDPTANSMTIVVIQGSATNPPTLVQTDSGIWQEPLAYVTIQSSGSMLVSDQRRFTSTRVGTWSTLTRPASPVKGKLGYNVDTGRLEVWKGTAWGDAVSTITPWTNITLNALFTGSLRMKAEDDKVYCQANFSLKSGTAFDASYVDVATLPAAFQPSFPGRVILPAFASGTASDIILLYSAGKLQVARNGTAGGTAYFNGLIWLLG